MHDGGLPGLDLRADARGSKPILEARAVSLDRDGRRLLKQVDLTLADDGITVLMGPNGAGKSLLLKVLHGLVAPTRGAVICSGAALSAATRRRQAMVLQTPILLRRSVAANVDFVLRSRGVADADRRNALLAHVGLAGRGRKKTFTSRGDDSGTHQKEIALWAAAGIDPVPGSGDWYRETGSTGPGAQMATRPSPWRTVFHARNPSPAQRLGQNRSRQSPRSTPPSEAR